MTEVAYFEVNARYGSFNELVYTLAGATNRYTYRSPTNGGAAGSTGTANVVLLNVGIGGNTPENTIVASSATVAGAGIAASFTDTATVNIELTLMGRLTSGM